MKVSEWEYSYKNNQLEIIPNSPITRPSFFYKYYSITEYNIHAILNSKLYFSHPLVFNDLFEASIQMIDLKKITQQELLNLYDKYRETIWVHEKKDYYSMKKFVQNQYKTENANFLRTTLTFYWNIIFIKTGVLSLASIDNNILLWSYYTNHTGVAIEFSDLLLDKTEIFGPYPIHYTDKYETVSTPFLRQSNLDFSTFPATPWE